MKFHPYEPRLYAASADSGMLMIFDTAAVGATSTFHSGVAKGHRLTSMQVVNEERDSLLMVGSSDGVVRLWRDLESPLPSPASSWRAVQKLRGSRDGQGAGLILAWHQARGQLLAGGDVPHINVRRRKGKESDESVLGVEFYSCCFNCFFFFFAFTDVGCHHRDAYAAHQHWH